MEFTYHNGASDAVRYPGHGPTEYVEDGDGHESFLGIQDISVITQHVQGETWQRYLKHVDGCIIITIIIIR